MKYYVTLAALCFVTSTASTLNTEKNDTLLQMQETVRSLFCRIDDGKQVPCLTGNVTEKKCKSSPGCCFSRNNDDSISCYKMNLKKTVRLAIENNDMYSVLLVDEDEKRKAGDITIDYYINCYYGHYYQNGCDQMCTWFPWSAWSGCEGACGIAVQKRFRRCNGCAPGEGNCVGNTEEHKRCLQPVGQQCGYWSGWSAYGSCSSSCGKGNSVRTRECLGGQSGQKGCLGLPTMRQECNSGDGYFYIWGQWSSCSASCGGGFRRRTQAHSCGYAANLDQEVCNTQACCGKLPWSQWGACSSICNKGTQTRTRGDICPVTGMEIETRTCDAGPGNYGAWSAWGACSQTCEGGYQMRKKSHSCGLADVTEPQMCGEQGFYRDWSEWSTCSQTCVGGISTRVRSHTCGKPEDVESKGCGSTGDFYTWQAWSACSSSCHGGEKYRSRYHQCSGMNDVETMACGQLGGYSNWGYWSACSQSCVGGSRTRTRFPVCGGEADAESQTCGGTGAWGEYSQWSTCTKPCGTGQRFRSRVHSCPNALAYNAVYGNFNTGVDRKEETCNTQPCCYYYDWAQWSACSITCGYGKQQRKKENSCPTMADQMETKYCNAGEGVYQPWTQWTSCSQSCRGGTRKRSREHTCDKPAQIETGFCGVDAGYAPWTDWSECTKTCGSGYMSRSRSHICGTKDQQMETIACGTNPGVYLPPGPWGPCSQTCPGGQKSRTSRHTCGGDERVDVSECGGNGNYGMWSEWSSCSSTCRGEQTRMQTNSCGLNPKVESRVCGSGGSWREYTTWSSCSQSCYGGTSFRFRYHSCPMLGEERQQDTETCGEAPSYGPWSLWGPCSVTCGKGVQTRSRPGICGNIDQTEEIVCGTKDCCTLLPWSRWSACSTTCFTGLQERTRTSTCSHGQVIAKELKNCTSGDGAYKDWSSWTPCPTACGVPAIQTRQRSHSCLRSNDVASGDCPVVVCARWSDWATWGPCTKTCFEGVMTRTRYCINGTNGDQGCIGSPVETRSCVGTNGTWVPWGVWSDCSATCNGGTRKRTRGNTCGASLMVETSYCNTEPGIYQLWNVWSACSATCGGGLRKRYRDHTCGQPTQSENEDCNTDPGIYYRWTQWSECTATCAGGNRSRRRTHSCGLPPQVSVEACNTHEGEYLKWSAWLECSQTCGGGTKTRSRGHTCGLASETEAESCNDNVCPYWSGWTMWSDCTTTCYSGERKRLRECQGGIAGRSDGCLGSETEIIECEAGSGEWLPWDEFSPCDATCDGGTMIRRRTHSCNGKEDIQREPCNTNPGMWQQWAPWAVCSRSCGEGMRSRHRTHTCGLPQQETYICVVNRGEYIPWSQWTKCSRKCNGGVRNRTRLHTCGVTDDTFESERCNTGSCAYWGGWSNYGPCSKTCGEGSVMGRSRQCIGGQPGMGYCQGEKSQNSSCKNVDCCDWDWSGWGNCCHNNNLRQIRIRMRGNNCGMNWEEQSDSCEAGISASINCDNEVAVWSNGVPTAMRYRNY